MNARGIFSFLLICIWILVLASSNTVAQKASAEFISSVPPMKLETGEQVRDGIQNLYYKDQRLYVTNVWAGLQVLDVTNMNEPVELGTFRSEARTHNVYVQDNYAYLSKELGGVAVVAEFRMPDDRFKSLRLEEMKLPRAEARRRVDLRDSAAPTGTVDWAKRVQEQRTAHRSTTDPVGRYGQRCRARDVLLDPEVGQPEGQRPPERSRVGMIPARPRLPESMSADRGHEGRRPAQHQKRAGPALQQLDAALVDGAHPEQIQRDHDLTCEDGFAGLQQEIHRFPCDPPLERERLLCARAVDRRDPQHRASCAGPTQELGQPGRRAGSAHVARCL